MGHKLGMIFKGLKQLGTIIIYIWWLAAKQRLELDATAMRTAGEPF